jgi:hypothetical protein
MIEAKGGDVSPLSLAQEFGSSIADLIKNA